MARNNHFGGFGGGANMQQLMRQAQKMQQMMMAKQEELDAREYEGTAGGGAVACKVSGKRQLTMLTIQPDAVDPDDVEMLTDLIVAAVNTAMKQAEEDLEKLVGTRTRAIARKLRSVEALPTDNGTANLIDMS